MRHFRESTIAGIALLLFMGVFGGLTAIVALWYMDWSSVRSFLYFAAFEFLLIGIAHDIAVSTLTLVLPPYDLPKLRALPCFPPVALLITLCDDAIPDVLEHLHNQDYPNYQVFVLDDSQDLAQRALADSYGYTVLRRPNRHGFKGGNLNNWLDQYGTQYKYFVILDNDTKLPSDFVTRMVEYAEHPQNRRIAVFQSKILPWNTTLPVPRLLGVFAPLSMQIMERTTNRMGNILSFGHNNLSRTDCVIEVGGFHENLTAEDTVLSLLLDGKGYGIKLVNVVSYDAEPGDVFRYARRTTRWAKQTVELFRLPWDSASLFLKITICYNLYTYLRLSFYFALLGFMAWTSLTYDARYSPDVVATVLINHTFQDPWFIILWFVMGIWLLPLGLHFVLARRAGISLRHIVLGMLVSIALIHFVVVPVTLGMLRTAFGKRVAFVPTNAAKLSVFSMHSIVSHMGLPLFLGGVIVASIVLQNQYEVFALNCVWILLLLFSPIVLWMLQEDNGTFRGKGDEIRSGSESSSAISSPDTG